MTRRYTPMLSACLLLCILLAVPVAYARQPGYRTTPVSDDAYRMLIRYYDYDTCIPLDARIVETGKTDLGPREKVVFSGADGQRVPGWLALPADGEGPCPVIILLHGFTGNKDEWWQDDSFYGGGLVTKRFIPAGYAVLALDARFHGERRAFNDYEVPRDMRARGWDAKAAEMVADTIVDYRRAIDWLCTRADIDSTRIGVHGYSMGGMMAFLLTAAEPRIRVTVSCVTWNWKTGSGKYAFINPFNVARGIGDRPFLMLMGTNDPLLPRDVAGELYETVRGPATDIRFFDAGHRLPDEYIDEALRWFRGHL